MGCILGFISSTTRHGAASEAPDEQATRPLPNSRCEPPCSTPSAVRPPGLFAGAREERPGSRGPRPRSISERVAQRVIATPGPLATPCLVWQGARGGRPGRPYMMSGSSADGTRRPRPVHKLLWVELHGEPPEGYDVHHRCENIMCVADDHLMLLEHGVHSSLHKTQEARSKMSDGMKRYLHERWHLNRGLVSPSCSYCSSASTSSR